MVNTRTGGGIDLPGAQLHAEQLQMETWTPERDNQGETPPTPHTGHRERETNRDNEVPMMDENDDRGSSPQTEGPELDKQLRLVQLQIELARLQQANRPARQRQDQTSNDDFTAYTKQRVDPTSEVGRYITAFHETTKSIRRPTALSGTPTYTAWRSSILLAAKQAGIEHILKEQQIEPPSADERVAKLWHAQNAWLHGFMWSAISTDAQSHFKAPDEILAYSLWDILETTFAERPQAVRKRLFRDLIYISTKALGSDRNLIERTLTIRTELDRLGYPLPDWVLFDIVQMRLSLRWQEFMQTRLDQADRHGDKAPEDDFVTLMKDILTRLPTTSEPKPEKKLDTPTSKEQRTREPSSQRGRTPRSTDGTSQQGRTCHYCESPKHMANNCWYKNPSLADEGWRQRNTTRIEELRKKYQGKEAHTRGRDKTPTDGHINSCMEVPDWRKKTTDSTPWIMDSGGGSHATGDPSLVRNMKPQFARTLQMANGTKSLVKGTGRTDLPVDGGAVRLNEVRLVEGLKTSIISFGLLVRQGYTFEQLQSNGQHSILWTSPDRTFNFETPLTDENIYALNPPSQASNLHNMIAFTLVNKRWEIEPKNVDQVLANTKEVDDSFLAPNERARPPTVREDTITNWHRRLGHMNAHDICVLAKDPRLGIKIKGMKRLEFCETCMKAKQARKPFRPATRATRPGYRIYVDLAGGGDTLADQYGNGIPTYGGARYILILTDDATRYRWGYLLGTKSEAIPTIKNWIKMIYSTTGRKIGIMHHDQGREFVNEELRGFYRNEGTQMEVTSPDTPQSNGQAERSNRIIMERVRSLLFDADLPKPLWGEAFTTAIVMKNLSPTATTMYGCKPNTKPLTPFEAWTGLQPNANWIRRWGCDAWLKDLKETSKLGSRSKKMKFVGYRGLNYYRLWDPESGKLTMARDVDFNENLTELPTINATAECVRPSKSAQVDFELPDELDVMEPKKGWQHSLLTYLHKEKPDIMKQLVDGNLAGLLEPSYLATEQDILVEPEAEKNIQDNEPVLSTLTDQPATLADAKQSPDWNHWQQAIQQEVNGFQEKNTYTLMERQQGMKVLTGKWVFNRKLNTKGETVRFRARWVVRGFLQEKGVHYKHTYAAVVSGPTTRALFAVTAARSWKSRSIDYVSAFLNGTLPEDEVIYMELPTGVKHGRGKLVGLLRQSLYGLKQAARVWYSTATEHLKSIGFRISPYDAGLLIHKTKPVYMTLHVDDCRITGPNQQDIDWVVQQIATRFEIKNVDDSKPYLGMKIEKQANGDLAISQEQYIDELLTQFGMEDCVPKSTPMEKGLRIEFTPDDDPGLDQDFTPTNYRKGTGSLQYLVTCTRPDIAYATNYLARFNSRPNRAAWIALKRVLRYLKGTKSQGIIYKANKSDEGLRPTAYSDSDWAGADPAYKSTSGYIITLNGAPVSWRSQRQSSVSKSSTEAEYISASEAACELVWLNDLLLDAGIVNETPTPLRTSRLQIDNKGAVDLVRAEAVTRRSRHIEIRHHMIRDWVDKGEIEVEHVAGTANRADGLTKALPMDPYTAFRESIGIRTIKTADDSITG